MSAMALCQDLSKTITAKQITVRMDTIAGNQVENTVFKFQKDSVYIRDQRNTISKLDSIIAKKKKQKMPSG